METYHEHAIRKPLRVIHLSVVIIMAFLAVIALLAGFRIMSVQASTITVGLITSPGPLADLGFNWYSYQGLLRAETEFGIVGTVYTSTDPTEIEPNVQQCALDGNDLCIGVGFWSTEPISNSAVVYTNTKFALIDGAYDNYQSNLRGVMLASEEVGYLAGT